jgi:hypothetical protein
VKEFITAAKDASVERDEDDELIFMHNGTEVCFIRPSEGQFLMMLSMGGRSMKTELVGNFIQLFIEMGDRDTQNYFRDQLMDRESGFTVTGEGGMFDIWEYIVGEWSGKNSRKPSASRDTPSAPGRTSTVRSRRSTSSRSQPAES